MSKRDDNWSTDEVVGGRPRRRGGWLGWVMFVLAVGGAGCFIWYVYLPLRAQRTVLEQRANKEAGRVADTRKQLRESEEVLAEVKRTKESLASQLAQTVTEKEKIEGELKRLQGELTAKLEPEIQAGNVRIKRRGNELVVDLADQILFDVGKSEVNENGMTVLGQVAPTLAALQEYAIQIAGHTDSTRVTSPATQERFPTNWELSTARATNVVRFLQETGKVPGERLVAMGFAQYRPAAGNETTEGRKKNRRIELVLFRKNG